MYECCGKRYKITRTKKKKKEEVPSLSFYARRGVGLTDCWLTDNKCGYADDDDDDDDDVADAKVRLCPPRKKAKAKITTSEDMKITIYFNNQARVKQAKQNHICHELLDGPAKHLLEVFFICNNPIKEDSGLQTTNYYILEYICKELSPGYKKNSSNPTPNKEKEETVLELLSV
uniref:Uncharacterized protein n=1 Tax=Glossina pallidipes TaxID=7398 RepID=A0A1B0A4B7_GLOPL